MIASFETWLNNKAVESTLFFILDNIVLTLPFFVYRLAFEVLALAIFIARNFGALGFTALCLPFIAIAHAITYVVAHDDWELLKEETGWTDEKLYDCNLDHEKRKSPPKVIRQNEKIGLRVNNDHLVVNKILDRPDATFDSIGHARQSRLCFFNIGGIARKIDDFEAEENRHSPTLN